MDIKHVMKGHAYQNVPLNFEEAYWLGCYAVEGCMGNELAQIQSIAALSALHNRATYLWQKATSGMDGDDLPDDAAEQIAGICAAIFDKDIGRSEFGFLKPKVSCVMDNCGMGGDLTVTANVSTVSALIAAAAGIHMCKHGSPANADAGRHGSSDFVSMLGINTMAYRTAVEEDVEQNCFGYTEALDTRFKLIHMQTHEVAKLPHMNDIIGPVTNPVDPRLMRRRVLGVNHLISPELIAKVYKILNEKGVTSLEHGIFIRGFVDKGQYVGMDEVSICAGGTQCVELIDGEIFSQTLTASTFGMDEVSDPSEISPPSGMSKGEFSLKILEGQITGPPLEMVLANTSLLFYLAGFSNSFVECAKEARAIHQSKKALDVIAALV